MEYRSPRTYSYMAMSAIGATGVCRLVSILIAIAQILDPGRNFGKGSSLWIVLQSLLSLLEFPLFILCIVLFLVWLYRCYTNLSPLRAEGSEFTPGWAIGWWFIPFANIVKPFQVVRNLWNESDPELDPDGFRISVQSGAPALIIVWWITWLISNFADNLIAGAMETHSADDVVSAGYFFIFNGVLHIAASLLAIKVIWDITRRQEERHSRFGAIEPAIPPPPPNFEEQNIEH